QGEGIHHIEVDMPVAVGGSQSIVPHRFIADGVPVESDEAGRALVADGELPVAWSRYKRVI
ncbi:MAG: hypothetical protein QXD43_02065, partial [Candidatus Aenigmatarchaeota archaeon]